MGIEKIRRRLATTNQQVSDLTSMAGLNVSSALTVNEFTATVLNGGENWRGFSTVASGDATLVVSASQANSGFPILISLGNTIVVSHRSLLISTQSVTDGISFMAVLDKATVDDQEIVFSIFN